MPISLFGKLRRGSCQKWINCSHIQPSHIKPQKLSLIIKHIRGLFAGLFSVYHSSGGKQAFISTYLLYQGHYFNVSLSEWLAIKISCVTYRVFVNVTIKEKILLKLSLCEDRRNWIRSYMVCTWTKMQCWLISVL